MSNLSPADVLAALNIAEADLIALVGADWPKLEAQYRDLRARLEGDAGPAQMLAAAEVVELFAPFDAARERLNDALAAQTDAGAVLLGLADVAEQLGLDSAVSALFKDAAQSGGPHRLILQKSPTQAKSLKLGNLSFDFGDLAELVTGLIATTHTEIIGQTSYILLAAGVLLILRALYKVTAVKLDEREATVFWGFAQAAQNGEAAETAILAQANTARAEVGLEALEPLELKNALHKLAEIKSVARAEGKAETWRVIEKHNVKRP